MKKSDLQEISNLLDRKFDEKLINFATKEDLKSFATKEDIDNAVEVLARTVNDNFIENDKKHLETSNKLDKINEALSKRPTKDEIFDKWDNDISKMSCDVDALKYIHKEEWTKLPTRAVIKNAIR